MENMEGVVISRSNQVSPDPRVEKTAQALAESGRKVMVVGWDRSGQYYSPVKLAIPSVLLVDSESECISHNSCL